MDVGRLHCFLVATKAGDVIYERFFDRFTELEKAEIRAAFSGASSNVRMTVEEQDFIAPYKLTRFAFIPVTDTIFYLMGSGEYDEVGCKYGYKERLKLLTPKRVLLPYKWLPQCTQQHIGRWYVSNLFNAVVEILRVVIQVLKDVLGKAPSSGLLLEKYSKLCLVADEVINEGLLEAVDKEAIKKGIKGKVAWE